MSRAQRNTPCPCGSGKKHKHCCGRRSFAEATMPEDWATAAELRRLRHTHDEAVAALMRFAAKLGGHEMIDDAWDEFAAFGGLGESGMDPTFAELFFPWYLFLWTRGAPPEDAAADFPASFTIAAQLLDSRNRLTPTEREFVERVRRTPLSFWEVVEIEPGRRMRMRDLLLGNELWVYDAAASQTLGRWAIVLAQIAVFEKIGFIVGLAPFALPPSCQPEVAELAHDLGLGPESRPEDVLAFDIECIELYGDLLAGLFSPIAPQLRNTDGDPLEWTTSSFAFDPPDRSAVLDRLSTLAEISREDDSDEGEAMFVWLVDQPDNPVLPNVHKAAIRVGTDMLTTECNSRKRDDTLRGRMEVGLGALVRYVETTQVAIDVSAMAREASQRGGDPDGGRSRQGEGPKPVPIPIEDLPPELIDALRERFLAWADLPVPALDDQTPRQAARTPEGRRKVEALIKNWEYRSPEPMPGADFDALRAKLGLDAAG